MSPPRVPLRNWPGLLQSSNNPVIVASPLTPKSCAAQTGMSEMNHEPMKLYATQKPMMSLRRATCGQTATWRRPPRKKELKKALTGPAGREPWGQSSKTERRAPALLALAEPLTYAVRDQAGAHAGGELHEVANDQGEGDRDRGGRELGVLELGEAGCRRRWRKGKRSKGQLHGR
jgi:hypothetical protein